MAFLPRPVTMRMFVTPDCDGFFDAVLDDRLVDEHQHLLGLRLGGGQEPRAQAGGGKHRLADRPFMRSHRNSGRLI